MQSPITTHVLDTSIGRPAANVAVRLWRRIDQTLDQVGHGATDANGRILTGLIETADFKPGEYQLQFDTAAYFRAMGVEPFYPRVTIEFMVSPGEVHYHVPLLLSRFGYSTYRGS